ncbi:MAG: hypothetical protein QXR53_02435 [Candidatus Norongarragalinales archaeon]
MGHRGRERLVRCEKCGREVRRDKAVFIEKPILTNPLERKDVYSETYTRVLTREVSYCISCGKHGRIFEKKKKMQERQRERERFGRFGDRPFQQRRERPPVYGSAPQQKPAQEQPAAETPAAQETTETPAKETEEQQS